ncbi:MAG: protein phosphatase 2C domain-containing protein [Bifidobacteriaceae bacterium]|jgi:serine/threonine protein phosphatase PrpC|nr:protein phosphatase 2C domain-containing protein [Bifidobacteriaceae bacterium]
MRDELGATASAVKERRRLWMGGRLPPPDRGDVRAVRPVPTRPPSPPPPSPLRWVEFCAVTETGPTRPSHEDALVVGGVAALAAGTRVTGWLPLSDQPVVLAAVDGMGGYAGGAQAAGLVAATLAAEGARVDGAAWSAWLEHWSDRIASAGEAWGTAQMGATMAALRLTGDGVEVVNVGDCRVYRAGDGYVGQLSVDDRLPGGMGSGVTQWLGGGTRALDPHRLEESLGSERTRFMLCSDGLFGALDHAALRGPLVQARTASKACDALSAAALAAQASDNFSVIVADVSALGAAPPAVPPGVRL